MQQHGRKKRTAKRLCARHVTGLLFVCFVVIFLRFSGLLQKYLCKGQREVKQKSFQTKLWSRLSHKVLSLLPPPVLLGKVTSINKETQVTHFVTCSPLGNRRPRPSI